MGAVYYDLFGILISPFLLNTEKLTLHIIASILVSYIFLIHVRPIFLSVKNLRQKLC